MSRKINQDRDHRIEKADPPCRSHQPIPLPRRATAAPNLIVNLALALAHDRGPGGQDQGLLDTEATESLVLALNTVQLEVDGILVITKIS